MVEIMLHRSFLTAQSWSILLSSPLRLSLPLCSIFPSSHFPPKSFQRAKAPQPSRRQEEDTRQARATASLPPRRPPSPPLLLLLLPSPNAIGRHQLSPSGVKASCA